jgi:hypothetical protein
MHHEIDWTTAVILICSRCGCTFVLSPRHTTALRVTTFYRRITGVFCWIIEGAVLRLFATGAPSERHSDKLFADLKLVCPPPSPPVRHSGLMMLVAHANPDDGVPMGRIVRGIRAR